MIYWIIILSSAGFAISQLFKIKNKFTLGITIIQIIAILFSLVGNFGLPYFVDIALITYLISLLVVFFSSVYSDLNRNKKKLIILMAIPLLVTNLFEILHFHGAGWLGFLCIISLISFGIIIKRRNLFFDELAYLTMMFADAFIIILMRIIWITQKF